MCGISGYFSYSPLIAENERERAAKMCDALTHRGPDGHGLELFSHAVLAHNRLAIIDLEGGRQPLSSASGNSHIVFNGEIYNFRELREPLHDYSFRTQSDTEVILALYESEGFSGWRRLNGMYAFALWDEARQRGYLVRDPMGIKPLFYAEWGGRLIFGSEAKGLFAYGLSPELDTGALHQVLNFRYLTGDGSLFKGINQLPAGMMLTWSPKSCNMTSLSVVKAQDHSSEKSLPFSTETLEGVFTRAVTRHLVSDVPVGCFLSGGIDSALIAKLASDRTALSSYTLEIGDDPAEADNAEETAAWLGIANYRQSFALPDAITAHRDLLRHLEVPKVNALQGMMLAEFTASHVKVALSGLGADELFYGYNAHQIMWLATSVKKVMPGKVINRVMANLLRPFIAKGDWSEKARALEMLAAMPRWASVYGLLRNVWDAPNLRQRIYGERMLDADLPESFGWLAANFPQGDDPVTSMAAFEMKNKLVNDLLWHEDRVNMRVGLESRVPFLDAELVGYVQAQPRRILMPWGRKKHALKRYAQGILPERILKRKKSGFQLDIVSAAQNELKPLFDEYLNSERIRYHRLFNPAFVAEVRAAPARQDRRWHWFLLYLMAQTHILIEELHVA